MKPVRLKINFFLFFLAILFIGECYTYEFVREPDYPNYRKSNVENVVITYAMPSRDFVRLGTLIIRDFTGEIDDRSFINTVKKRSKELGAEGAWIRRKSLRDSVTYRSVPNNDTRPYVEQKYYQQGEISSQLGIVEIVLFNFNDDGDSFIHR
jgi:hypothetical protein